VLLDADGTIVGRYDKLRLVPFGEFIPFEGIAPWLRDILPPIGDFVPGREATVFHLSPFTSHPSPSFSVLICFEDTFPELAREFVQRGARLLMTITNDAWFGPTAAAYQHAQASTFRAVELGVPMIRAANTGWSGCMDGRGRWMQSVRDAGGQELFVEGVAVCDVAPGSSPTLYARWGDWFAWGCVLLGGCVIILCFASHGHLRRSHGRTPR
jgi:apolipoprotein N-acyltransferase